MNDLSSKKSCTLDDIPVKGRLPLENTIQKISYYTFSAKRINNSNNLL